MAILATHISEDDFKYVQASFKNVLEIHSLGASTPTTCLHRLRSELIHLPQSNMHKQFSENQNNNFQILKTFESTRGGCSFGGLAASAALVTCRKTMLMSSENQSLNIPSMKIFFKTSSRMAAAAAARWLCRGCTCFKTPKSIPTKHIGLTSIKHNHSSSYGALEDAAAVPLPPWGAAACQRCACKDIPGNES